MIVCAMCLLDAEGEQKWDRRSLDFAVKEELLTHLQEHRKAGHVVPDSAISAIEKDDWI